MTKRNRKDKFIALANSRTNRVIQQIRLIGNLSDKSNYNYTEEQYEKILYRLREEIDNIESRFDSGGDIEDEFDVGE